MYDISFSPRKLFAMYGSHVVMLSTVLSDRLALRGLAHLALVDI